MRSTIVSVGSRTKIANESARGCGLFRRTPSTAAQELSNNVASNNEITANEYP